MAYTINVIDNIETEYPGRIIHYTKAEFGSQRMVVKTIHIVQYDDSLPIVAVSLYKDGYTYTIPENATKIRFRWNNQKHTYVYDDALGISPDGRTVYFAVSQDMASYYGPCDPILELSIGNIKAGSSPIPVEVDRNPIQDGEVRGNPKYLDLDKAKQNAEAWAVGEKDGVPVGPDDPQYHNNSKWWAEHGSGGSSDFNTLINRPKYNGSEMTSETNIEDKIVMIEYNTGITAETAEELFSLISTSLVDKKIVYCRRSGYLLQYRRTVGTKFVFASYIAYDATSNGQVYEHKVIANYASTGFTWTESSNLMAKGSDLETKQDLLKDSGIDQNLKTINGLSILGTGNLLISGLPTITSSDIGKALIVKNDASGVEWEQLVTGVSSVNNKTGAVTLSANDVYTSSGQSIERKLDKIAEDFQDVEKINNKSQTISASTTNYPSNTAVMNFVNSSIATNTANFLGTSSSGLTESQFLSWANGLSNKTNNDYVFWNTTDSAGNVIFKRYKYQALSTSWLYEYDLNNSSFTAAQWNAINSAIDSTKVSNYTSHLSATNNPHNVSKAQVGLGNVRNIELLFNKTTSFPEEEILENVVDNTTGIKYNVPQGTYSKPSGGIPSSDLASAVQTSLGKADTAVQPAILEAHTSNTNNPHNVSKAQVGLGNVDNTSDLNKPISTATQTALNSKESKGKITIGGTEYEVVVSSTDAGVAGKITFVVEA